MARTIRAAGYEGPDRRRDRWHIGKEITPFQIVTLLGAIIAGTQFFASFDKRIDENKRDIQQIRLNVSRRGQAVQRQLDNISEKLDRLTDYLLRQNSLKHMRFMVRPGENPMDIKFQFDKREVEKLLKVYGDAVAPATASAINKTFKSIQSQSARKTAHAIGAPVKAVRVRLTFPKFSRATKYRLYGNMILWARPMKAHKFGKPSMRGGVASVKGQQGGRRIFPGSFVATMPSGLDSVFHRTGAKRLPIVEDEVNIESVAFNIASSTFREAVDKQLPKVWAHELDYRVRVKGR